MTIPKEINCIEITKPGGPENLLLVKRKTPKPNLDEVLIKVSAAGVNRPDIMQRQGFYPAPPGASDIPGLEIAGEIVEINSANTKFKLGDRVCALVSGGGYSSYCSAPIQQTLPIPKGLSFIQAAAIPETFFTVWTNVFDRGNLSKEDTILIHGGTSGIGTTAIQLARCFGAKVFSTAGSDEKCIKTEELGAELSINYKKEDFVEKINKHTNKKGVNIVLDMIGAEYFDKNLSILKINGKLVIIAFQGGFEKNLNLLPILTKRLTVTGSTLRPRTPDEKGLIAESLYKKVWPLIEKGLVMPQIYDTYKLEDASKAHTLMESSQHIGKIVLTV
jgi:NADPH2:quinone reductase